MERKAVAALGVLLAWCPCAFALNPSLYLTQYGHNVWTHRDGFGAIECIAQTPDGYLWLGTESGVFRYDGVRKVPWHPEGVHLPGSVIRSLLASRDGRLWIGSRGGLVSWKDGIATQYPELAGQIVGALIEDREGVIWAAASVPTARLCRIQNGSAQCYGEDGRFGREMDSLYEDREGNLWAGATTGLWRWKPGLPKRYPMPGPPQAMTEDDHGAFVIAMQRGIRLFHDGKADRYSGPGGDQESWGRRLLRDRDGSLWYGTDRGIVHEHQGRKDVLTQAGGLSGNFINSLFEDREGNIWVASRDGLDRFSELAVTTISVKQGLSDAKVYCVLGTRDGSVWMGTHNGLNRWNDGQITIYRKRSRELPGHEFPADQDLLRNGAVREVHDSGLPDDNLQSLFEDDRGRLWVATTRGVAFFENGRFIPVTAPPPASSVYSISGDRAGDLWFSQDQGLFRVRGGSVVERISWDKVAPSDYANSLLADSSRGGVWLGLSSSGVKYFKDGQVRVSYTRTNGLGQGYVTGLGLDPEGALWAASEGGLSRVKGGRIATLTSTNGLPCDMVHWAVKDDDGSFWLYMACGLVHIARADLDAWAEHSQRTVRITVFDDSDGVRRHPRPFASGTPHVTRSTDGKLWFLPFFDGVSVVDPRHLPFNRFPPPVHVEEVKVEGNPWDGSHGWRLPAFTRDLEIHFTALSLVAPEKNRFKYKLEGRDSEWKDAGGIERKVSYTDLPPRNYRFRVMASNNNGVWNETGDSLDFSINPAYYQTVWFRAACVAAFPALLLGLYRYRLHQVSENLNARLEGRVDERTRVARELHDTLLQSFHGVVLVLQGAYNLFPSRPEEAMRTLGAAIDHAGQAITEARDAVQGLRPSTEITNELARAVEVLAEELAQRQRTAGEDETAFSIQVEGASQELDQIIRDEIYRITGEALRNAFRHARAGRIEVEIRYDALQFRVRVRDDGIGMGASVLQEGQHGHWGLPGMRERADSIGGQLEVWSENGAGTEVELTVPASVAYRNRSRKRFRLFARHAG